MKYSIQAITSNLESRRFKFWVERTLKEIKTADPTLFMKAIGRLPNDEESLERAITVGALVDINEVLTTTSPKDFVMEDEIAQEFYNGHSIKQDYSFTLKLPFPTIFVSFTDPILIDLIDIQSSDEMNISYKDWLKGKFNDKKIKTVKNLLVGVLFQHTPKIFKERRQSTIDYFEKVGETVTMTKKFYEHYKKMNPDTTFKIYFIIKEKQPIYYNYTNAIIDTTSLPEFISEFALDTCTLEIKQNTRLVNALIAKLLDFAVQIINFINSTDYIEVSPTWKSIKSKEKYEQKFSRPLPPDFYMLRIKYPKDFIQGKVSEGSPKSPYRYQFDVRGHWRCLLSKKWTHKRGQVIWIPNFRKGRGVYIPKRYVVDSKPEILPKHLKKIEEGKPELG